MAMLTAAAAAGKPAAQQNCVGMHLSQKIRRSAGVHLTEMHTMQVQERH
jgi:hypothetical protein